MLSNIEMYGWRVVWLVCVCVAHSKCGWHSNCVSLKCVYVSFILLLWIGVSCVLKCVWCVGELLCVGWRCPRMVGGGVSVGLGG